MMKLTKIEGTGIDEKLKENNGYCPCVIVKNEDTKCMCKDFRDKINKLQDGETIICHCGLYKVTQLKD